jgi:hypothetical protein
MEQAKAILVSDAQAQIKTRKDYHRALQWNGYYVPKLSSTLCTNDWMERVREGSVWCPMYRDIRLQACPLPPSKKSVIAALQSAVEVNEKRLGITEHHQPDLQWALDVLSTMDPYHEVFQKGYTPAKRSPGAQIHNRDGFFTNLPPSTQPRKKRTCLVTLPQNKIDRKRRRQVLAKKLKAHRDRPQGSSLQLQVGSSATTSPVKALQAEEQPTITRQMNSLKVDDGFTKIGYTSTISGKVKAGSPLKNA